MKKLNSTLELVRKTSAFSLIVFASHSTLFAQQAPSQVAETSVEDKSNGKPDQFVKPKLSFLPGSLIGWSAQLNNNRVSLKWTTTFEKNSNTFVVERSTNGIDYNTVSSLQAAHNSDKKKDYAVTDNLSSTISGIVYYRLRLTDMDSESRYSEVKIIRQASSQDAVRMQLFPNPTVNEIRVTVASNWQDDKVVYEIYNSHGHLVKSKTNERTSQTEVFNVSSLPAGIYVMKISNGTDKSIQQFIKSN